MGKPVVEKGRRFVWVDGVGLVDEADKPKPKPRPVQLVSNVNGNGAPRRTYVMRDGKLVEINRNDPEFMQRRPGRKWGMFVGKTIRSGDNVVRIEPGKKTRERIRREGWRP